MNRPGDARREGEKMKQSDEVKELPIIMTAESVRGILDGRKSMTRRVIKPQPSEYVRATVAPQELAGKPKKHSEPYFDAYAGGPYWCWWDEYDRQAGDWIKCPYGKPGDRLWVREAWADGSDFGAPERQKAFYRADRPRDPDDFTWKTPIFMPRWASRITLEITGASVERVQEIGLDDVLSEGISEQHSAEHADEYWRERTGEKFVELWDSINAKRGFGWDNNPWVWVISFKPLEVK